MDGILYYCTMRRKLQKSNIHSSSTHKCKFKCACHTLSLARSLLSLFRHVCGTKVTAPFVLNIMLLNDKKSAVSLLCKYSIRLCLCTLYTHWNWSCKLARTEGHYSLPQYFTAKCTKKIIVLTLHTEKSHRLANRERVSFKTALILCEWAMNLTQIHQFYTQC